MPAHGRRWLWGNRGTHTHLDCLWFASLISSPGHRGVSPQAHGSGFCIIHIFPQFLFHLLFSSSLSIISERLSLKKKNVNYRRLWIDVMWKEGSCFPSLQTGSVVFKTNKPLKPHEVHFSLLKWLFSEGKRIKKKQRNVCGAMSWLDGEWSQPLRMQTIPFLRSKVQGGEGSQGRDSEVLAGERDWTEAEDRNFMVHGFVEKVGAKGWRGK